MIRIECWVLVGGDASRNVRMRVCGEDGESETKILHQTFDFLQCRLLTIQWGSVEYSMESADSDG